MRRNIIILGLLLLLILGAITILILRSSSTPQINGPKSLENLAISQVSPANQSKDVGIYPPINVTFNRAVTVEEQPSITIAAEPALKGTSSWSSDGTFYSFASTTPLLSAQKYLLTVTFGSKKYLWEFTTISADSVTTEDQNKAQEQADRNFGEWSQQLYQNYPWFDKLPLQTNSYFVYFDIDKKQLIAELYPSTQSTTPTETQVENLKREIQAKLQQEGVDIATYQPIWDIKPQP